MFTVRNLAIAGVAVVAAVSGGFWTQNRETNSPCEGGIFDEFVHAEIRDTFKEESKYLAALIAGSEHELVSEENRQVYADAAAALIEAVDQAEIVGRMKHPSHSDLASCHLQFRLNNVLADFDLGQPTTFGFPVDREFEVTARFKIRFKEMDGETLKREMERKSNDWLVESISAGELVETARTAKLTRRDITISEPEFLEINYATSIVAETDLEPRYFRAQ